MTTVLVELREIAVAAVRAGRSLTDGELRRIGVPPLHATAMAAESRRMVSVDDAIRLAEHWAQTLMNDLRGPERSAQRKETTRMMTNATVRSGQ